MEAFRTGSSVGRALAAITCERSEVQVLNSPLNNTHRQLCVFLFIISTRGLHAKESKQNFHHK